MGFLVRNRKPQPECESRLKHLLKTRKLASPGTTAKRSDHPAHQTFTECIIEIAAT